MDPYLVCYCSCLLLFFVLQACPNNLISYSHKTVHFCPTHLRPCPLPFYGNRAVAVRPPGEACPLAEQVSCEGSYVVTGGTGGIGLDLALRFAKAGAGGLVLLSRCASGDSAYIRVGSCTFSPATGVDFACLDANVRARSARASGGFFFREPRRIRTVGRSSPARTGGC